MYYKKDFDIKNFEFWSGAKDRVDELTYEQLLELDDYLEDFFIDTEPTETDINDLVWFEMDSWFEDKKAEREEAEDENN